MSESTESYEDPSASQTFDDESENNVDSIEENPFTVKSTPNKNKKSKTPVLDNFGRDLTAFAS
jgi:ATP-dependent Clp protease ATP-binding subunit ClpC